MTLPLLCGPVFALLDDVVLLSRGRLLWSGASSGMLTHFEAQGFAVPPLTNPAEFILDISSIDVRGALHLHGADV